MANLIDKLSTEKKQEVKTYRTKDNKNIEKIIELYRKNYINAPYVYRHWNYLVNTSNLTYSADDLSYLLLSMRSEVEKNNPSVGCFISALINNCKADNIIINTVDTNIELLGNYNTKNLKIIGNVGNNFCSCMNYGIVLLFGNAGAYLGTQMIGGYMYVNGDVDHSCGSYQYGGQIIIEGNCDCFVGTYLAGGTLIVNGNVGSHVANYMTNGNIIINGNALDEVGKCMSNGHLLVTGNVGDVIGEDLQGGIITILGNAGFEVGKGMIKDSKIYLEGDFITISALRSKNKVSRTNCEIYHKGILIFKEGKPIHPEDFIYYKPYQMYIPKRKD